MKNLLLALSILLFVSGCSTMTPARYSPSADNQVALRAMTDASAYVSQLSISADYSANCRLMGPIQATDGMTIPEFIQKAIDDEFKMAGIHSTDGVALAGDITKIAFSSVAGVTGGWWEIALSLSAENGNTVSADIRHEFRSGFDAVTACNQTAQALGPAVQDLIHKLVSDPAFPGLVKAN